MMTQQGWIAVDLDGTLAHYDQWRGNDHIGDPIGEMAKRVKQWLSDGHDVRIFTARVFDDPDGVIARFIQSWCEKHFGVALPVTNQKDYGMVELWDDRAVQVVPNEGRAVERERDNLAILVKRLAMKLPKETRVREQALDYLKLIGQQGSVLR